MTDKGNNLIGSIDITPNTDFENGINFGFNATAGIQGKELISTLPDYFRSNPVTYSLELQINESESLNAKNVFMAIPIRLVIVYIISNPFSLIKNYEFISNRITRY